jgi:hypothetical protein
VSRDEVIDLMGETRNACEWVHNINVVIAAFGGNLPDFWREAILDGGVVDKVFGKSKAQLRTEAIQMS